MGDFVAYYRVSTQRQGTTGLGLDAQRNAVQAFVLGARGQIIGEYEEIESGSRSDRPKLSEAIQRARVIKATLVIAKLDRLARNVSFISRLMDSGVDFVAADLPYANRLTIHIIAAVAEYEREMISHRTRAALAAAKARGVRLGNPRAANQAINASAIAVRSADAFASSMFARVNEIRAAGQSTYSAIARALNAQGVPTQRRKAWTATGVKNLIVRAQRIGLV